MGHIFSFGWIVNDLKAFSALSFPYVSAIRRLGWIEIGSARKYLVRMKHLARYKQG